MNSQFLRTAAAALLFTAAVPFSDTALSTIARPLIKRAQADDNTKQNMVAFFMETGCPAGWTDYTAGQGRLLLGVNDATKFNIGTTVVTAALGDQEVRTHTHTYATTVDLGSKNIEAASHNNDQGASPGTKNVPSTQPGTTGASSSNMPLIQLTVCEKTDPPTDPSAADPFPQGALAFFNSKTCPAGSDPNNPEWKVASLAGSDFGHFLMPFFNPPAETLGALVGNGLSPGEDRTHTHGYSSSITTTAVEYEGAWGCYDVWPVKLCLAITESGTKSFSGTTSASSSGMPYVTLLVCQQTSFVKNANPPQDVPTFVATFFTTDTCPTGWKMTEATTGRYLVGLPEGGVPGAAFGGNPLVPTEQAPTPVAEHDHSFSGNVETGDRLVDLLSGCCAHDAGGAGTYDYSGTTASVSADLPYYGVIQCQPCIENDPDQACQATQ